MKKSLFFFILFAITGIITTGQEALKYQKPPDEIVKLMEAEPSPLVSVSPDKKYIALLKRPGMPTIKDLAARELRIAGLRINPEVNGRSRSSYYTGLRILTVEGQEEFEVKNLPSGMKIAGFSWSDDGKCFAFVNTAESSIDLWQGDIESMSVRKIASGLNTVTGGYYSQGFSWCPASHNILYQSVVPGRGPWPEVSAVPPGPVVQENLGAKGAARTFQDLLKGPADEALFTYFARSVINIWDGSSSVQLGKPGIYSSISISPDGNYILVEEVVQPYSYIVPYYYFPGKVYILDRQGNIVRELADKKLKENLPRGFDMTFAEPSSYTWRADKPASLYWVEPLDSGDINREMEYHDQVYMLDAPFTGDASKYIATRFRFSGITWGKDDYAILSERSRKERISRHYSFDPGNPESTVKQIFEISTDDRYNDPGRPVTTDNKYGRRVLLFDKKGKSIYLSGQGSSPEGDRPFFDRYDIASGKTERLWRSEAPFFESVNDVIDISRGLLLTSRESQTEPPNYYIRDIRRDRLSAVTAFTNPYTMLKGVTREKIRYKRDDGIDLSMDLYLPAAYDKDRDGPLPAIMWAYPREYKSAKAAGQVSGSPYRFTRVSPSSIIALVTQGYAIMNNATFPIVGEGDDEPNDTFREQLVANAKAAIDKGAELGVVDRGRVGVGGHSYGAFMTANLLAHSRLFAAGVARSGAYNRTLTPFGFQNERRTYWEAPDVYNYMAPFMHADKVKDPILLIHGQMDNNSGTFPIQSDRYFGALKGHGATVRLVFLPYESHGYSAAESLMHMQWETLEWFNRYVKNKE